EKMTAREQAGYLGPVQTVKSETAEFSTQDGKRVEGARVPSLETSYNRRGDVTEERWYDSSGNLDFRVLFTHDAKGNVREVVRRDAQDNLLERHVYRHDSKGRPTESLAYDSEGQLTAKGEYRHDAKKNAVECVFRDEKGLQKNRRLDVQDAKGRRIRTEWYDADNTLKWRTLISYNPNDAKIEETSCDYNPDGSLDRKTVSTYDARRRILSEATYAAAGSLLERFEYTYEYDWRGNPIKQTRLRLVQKEGLPGEGASIYEPESVTYLTLTYFPDAPTQ
ncbi:MAG: hypothetical protein Q8Q12_00850, partial [bacterium]|nr:hypothetical protein [bacterium]